MPLGNYIVGNIMEIVGCCGVAGSAPTDVLELISSNFWFATNFRFVIFVLIWCYAASTLLSTRFEVNYFPYSFFS